MGGGGILLIQ